MEQDLLLGMVKELWSSERGIGGGESCNSDTWKGCPAPLQLGAPLGVPLSLSYMCCRVKKRNCRLLEKFEKLMMYSVVGNWSRKISGRESRNLKAGDTVDVIIK